jgi:hypothetical protein
MVRVVLVVVAVLVVGAAGTPSEVVAQEPLSISGSVWSDQNSDGVRQPGDVGIIRRQVFLAGPLGVTRQTQTDRDGRYVFSDLAAGTYSISLSDQSLAIQTSPEKRVRPPYTRTVELSTVSVAGVDFGFGMADRLTGFSGLAFINAAPVDDPKVRAFINGQDCTGPQQLIPPDLDHAFFWISVLSSDLLPACGNDGDIVSFTVNGLNANETANYSSVPEGTGPLQDGRGRIRLTVGSSFALFSPRIVDQNEQGQPNVNYFHTVAAIIDDKVCAVGLSRVWASIMIIVPSETMKPGCGREGAVVSFAVEGFAVDATRIWSAKPESPVGDDDEGLVLDLVRSEQSPLVGPRFAYYWIALPEMVPTHPLFDEVEQIVTATIDGEYCGQARGVGPRRVLVAVAPAELREGCGRPGATVAFSQTDEPYATAPWQPGFHDGPAAPGIAQAGELAPTPAEVRMPSQDISPPSVGDSGMR